MVAFSASTKDEKKKTLHSTLHTWVFFVFYFSAASTPSLKWPAQPRLANNAESVGAKLPPSLMIVPSGGYTYVRVGWRGVECRRLFLPLIPAVISTATPRGPLKSFLYLQAALSAKAQPPHSAGRIPLIGFNKTSGKRRGGRLNRGAPEQGTALWF